MVHRRRTGGDARRHRVGPSWIDCLCSGRLQDAPRAIGVQHTVAAQQELARFGVDEQVVGLRRAIGLELDVPGEPQAAVHRKPDKGGRDIAQERPALESSGLESGGVSDANRNEGCTRVDVAGSHAGGHFRGDRRLPSSTLSARGARRDPHDFARRCDVDGDGATKHRNAVERLRERDVTHSRGSTHVVAHGRQRVQVFVLESEAIDVPHQLVPQGDGESRPGSGPAGRLQDAHRTGIRIQTRTATTRERCAAELGPSARRSLRRRPPLADVEVRAERARPDRRLLTGRQRSGQTDDGTGREDEGKTGPRHHDALLLSCSETPEGPDGKRR